MHGHIHNCLDPSQTHAREEAELKQMLDSCCQLDLCFDVCDTECEGVECGEVGGCAGSDPCHPHPALILDVESSSASLVVASETTPCPPGEVATSEGSGNTVPDSLQPLQPLLANVQSLLSRLSSQVEVFPNALPLEKRHKIISDLALSLSQTQTALSDLNVQFPHVHHSHVSHHHPHTPKSQQLEVWQTEPASIQAHSDYLFQLLLDPSGQCQWDQCQHTSNNPLELSSHVVSQHVDVAGSMEQYLCEWDHCGYVSGSVGGLAQHVSQHVGLAAVVAGSPKIRAVPPTPESPSDAASTRCGWEGCSQTFLSLASLTAHVIADHVGSGCLEYVCRWAGCTRNCEPFTQRQKIIRHVYTHTKHKPHACEVCGAAFASASVLVQHSRIHSGERPYSCAECGKLFATSTALSIHTRTHTGLKPLVCKFPGCGKRFSESSNLAKHMRVHNRMWTCGCGMAFGKKTEFTRHQRGCSGVKQESVSPLPS